jgi:hypothetical protein
MRAPSQILGAPNTQANPQIDSSSLPPRFVLFLLDSFISF